MDWSKYLLGTGALTSPENVLGLIGGVWNALLLPWAWLLKLASWFITFKIRYEEKDKIWIFIDELLAHRVNRILNRPPINKKWSSSLLLNCPPSLCLTSPFFILFALEEVIIFKQNFKRLPKSYIVQQFGEASLSRNDLIFPVCSLPVYSTMYSNKLWRIWRRNNQERHTWLSLANHRHHLQEALSYSSLTFWNRLIFKDTHPIPSHPSSYITKMFF